MSASYGEPVRQHKFREVTENHKKMAGCTMPSFRCRTCNGVKPVKGRKLHLAGGYECADCAPRPQEAAPVAQKNAVQPVRPKKEENQAKAREMLLTDEQVIECRTAYEFAGAKPATLMRYYGVTKGYMRSLLDYAVRSRIIPPEPSNETREALRALFCDPNASWRNDR